MEVFYYMSIGFIFGLFLGLVFGGSRSTMKVNEKPQPSMPKYKSAPPPPPRSKSYQPDVDNTTNPHRKLKDIEFKHIPDVPLSKTQIITKL